METTSNKKPPEKKTRKKLLQREKGSFNRFDNLPKMNSSDNLTQRFEKASRLSKSFYDFVSIDKSFEKCTPHNFSYSYYFDANLESRKDAFSSNNLLFKEGVKRYNSVEGSLVSSSSSNDEEYETIGNDNKIESLTTSYTNSYESSENLTNTQLFKSLDNDYGLYDKPSFVVRGSYDNDGNSHFYNIDYRDEKFNIERTMPDLNWNYLEKELQRAMEEINVKDKKTTSNQDIDGNSNRNNEGLVSQSNSLVGEEEKLYTDVEINSKIALLKKCDMKPILEENNTDDTKTSIQSIEDSINKNIINPNTTSAPVNNNFSTNHKQTNYIDSIINGKDKDVKYRSFDSNGPIKIRDQVLKKMMLEAQRDGSFSYGSEDDDDGYDDCDGKVRRLIVKGNLPVCFLNEINDEEEDEDDKNNEIKNENVERRECSLTNKLNNNSCCISNNNVGVNNNLSFTSLNCNSNYQLHSEATISSTNPSQYSTLSSNCSELSEGRISRSTLQPLPSLVPRRDDFYDHDNNSYCCCKEYSAEKDVNCGSNCSRKSKFKIKLSTKKEEKTEKNQKYHHQYNDGFCARENFFNKQAKLQAQARIALAQVRPMAAMESELQRKNRKMIQFRGLEGGLDKRWCDGVWKLNNLNISQLQIIVNYLHDQINGLNKELMSLLEEREQSGIIQDSILVDVEDFTRLAEEWEYKKLINENAVVGIDDAFN